MPSNFHQISNSPIEDPSTRSESPPHSDESSIYLTGIKLAPSKTTTPTDDNSSDSNISSCSSSYKSLPSKAYSSCNNSFSTFHSALLPPHSPEKTISELDDNSIVLKVSASSPTEIDVNFEPISGSFVKEDETNKCLDYDDYFTTKKLLGKLCKTMVESSCHHGKKDQQLNKNLEKLEKSFVDNISVLNDFVIDFDVKTAEKAEAMIKRLDPQMIALQEISQFSSALDSLEEWLELTEVENNRDLNTLERAKQNLIKQKEYEIQVKQLEEFSFKRRAMFDALELDDPRLIREAISSKNILDPNHYGIKENKKFIPQFLADLKDFETNLSKMKLFFVSAGLLHEGYFDKMEDLIKNVKNEVQERIEPLSATSSMASLLSIESYENPMIDFSTKDFCYIPSSSEDEIAIEVSRSATNCSNSEATHKFLATESDSTQTSSYHSDTVDSTQTSISNNLDTVDSTQSFSTDFDTEESTQQSLSEKSITSESSLSTCPSFDLECDKTQRSDASVETAISAQESSLKTAMSLHDIISNDSMDSSSTIAI